MGQLFPLSRKLLVVFLFTCLSLTAPAEGLFPSSVDSRGGAYCAEVLAVPKPAPSKSLQHLASVSGLVIGAVNGVVLSLTAGQLTLIPPDIAKWLLFFNETANALSTASGRTWIYSGNQKRVIDGIALGAIVGQTLSVASDKGPLAGAINMGVTYGLSYWFPNTYFHSLMLGVPKLLPKALRPAASSGVGQGVIGISMIVALEQILVHAQDLAQAIPHFLALSNRSPRTVAGSYEGVPPVSLEHALAMLIIDSKLPSSFAGEVRDQEILYLSGATAWGDFFAKDSSIAPPTIQMNSMEKEQLRQELNSGFILQLLTSSELSGVLNRIN